MDNVKNFVSEQFVIVGHHAESVEKFVQTNYENSKTVLQSPQLGTGHAVSMVCPSLENFDGLVLILCGIWLLKSFFFFNICIVQNSKDTKREDKDIKT